MDLDGLKKQARIAGFLYLSVAIIAPIGLMYVPSVTIVRGDAAATAARILASEPLFRIGIAAKLASAILFLLTVLALYRLLRAVDAKQALLMVTLVAVATPISLLNGLCDVAALTLVSGPDFLSAFGRRELDGLGYLFLRLRGHGSTVAMVFWGLWLFPFGALVIRSGFIPRLFGYLLILNGLAYVAQAVTAILVPAYSPIVSRFAMAPIFAGELSIIAWLLIRGARMHPSVAPAPSPAGG